MNNFILIKKILDVFYRHLHLRLWWSSLLVVHYFKVSILQLDGVELRTNFLFNDQIFFKLDIPLEQGEYVRIILILKAGHHIALLFYYYIKQQ